MAADGPVEFGKRRPAPIPLPPPPPKRSHKVVLLLMGTLAVGGAAYGLMQKPNCDQDSSQAQDATERCASGRSSSGSGGSGSWRSSSGGSSEASARHVERGGFGSFARSFSAHFSGGG